MTPVSTSAYMLRYTRIAIAAAVAALLTGVVTAYGMEVPRMAGWIARIQFMPAAFAFALSTIVVWLIVTLVMGRIYCSTVCPLGTFQDVAARLHRRQRDYHYHPPYTALRRAALFVVVVAIVMGWAAVTSLIDPYSIYARFCVYVVKPVWGYAVNLLSTPPVKIAAASLTGIAVATLTMMAVGLTAWRSGRTFCNTLCPVGTTLGFVSRYSVMRIDINTDKCIECRKCEHRCKAKCIDLSLHVVDMSRCVVCFDCLPVCPNDAIHYTARRHQLSIPMMQRVGGPVAGAAGCTDNRSLMDRRAFLTAGLVMAALPAVAQAEKTRRIVGGLMRGQVAVTPAVAVTPPGVYRRSEFLSRCTGCGLCISHCPTGVLRPSTTEYGVLRMLHPVKDYDAAYCAYTCTRCTNLCPTGALTPLTKAEKRTFVAGLAHVDPDRCTGCGRCAEACPTEAVTMKSRVAVVDISKCVGCGACQWVCPAIPYKAITVNGKV